ncbi:hypothetical protein AZE42_13487 [Rhizopogon vesiculosus]|uniref:CTLH domain-containing protein n=1 Tax=Rhizopogon vesiculosus TaxID=180088 RepID=A0A1J8QQT6_9AGAM|nr:hypothetical protein AZE42_13487 [Rhizopogon vesiculosus]
MTVSPARPNSALPTDTISSPSATCTIRLLTSSPTAKTPLFLVVTPNDRTVAAAEGSSIWQFQRKSWGDQIDELVPRGLYSDALSLINTLDTDLLPDKDQGRTHVGALRAVSQFRLGKFDAAIDSFLELDLNPAKVLALYPVRVSGRLSVPADDWIPLFGGPASQSLTPKNDDAMLTVDNATKEKPSGRSGSPAASVLTPVRRGTAMVGTLLSSPKDKDDDTASLSGKKKVKSKAGPWMLCSDILPIVVPNLQAHSQQCTLHLLSLISGLSSPKHQPKTAEYTFGSADSGAACAGCPDCGYSAIQVLSHNSASPP